MKSEENGSSGSREEDERFHDFIPIYCPGARAVCVCVCVCVWGGGGGGGGGRGAKF